MKKFKTRKKSLSLVETVKEHTLADKSKEQPTLKTETMGKCPVKITMEGDSIQKISFKGPFDSMADPFINVLQNLTSTQDYEIAKEILVRSTLAMPKDKESNCKISIMLQSLADSAPKDATEARLSLQIIVLYSQGMMHLFKAENCNRIDHREFYMKNAIKLLRLHNETIEAIGKYRRGGEQRVVVQHVQVNHGGQAIVGSVLNGDGGK